MSCMKLLEIHHAAFKQFSDWWIGVNCLDLTPSEVFSKISEEVSGVWVDNAMIDEYAENQVEAKKIQEARLKSGWQGLYFGGVAFKYQRPVDNLSKAALIAADYMDVVTTSGVATGKAADFEKVFEMKKA